jgi:hypothetical protein
MYAVVSYMRGDENCWLDLTMIKQIVNRFNIKLPDTREFKKQFKPKDRLTALHLHLYNVKMHMHA